MFRRLYWITEQVKGDGTSNVTGVFTSIPNLLKEGFSCNDLGCLRLTLMKLDSDRGSLGTWNAPDFAGLGERLQDFVKTEEFSADQCEALVSALSPSSV